jgi:hypothetical protein
MNRQLLTKHEKVCLAMLGVAAITALPVARSVPQADNAVIVTQFQLPLDGTTSGINTEDVQWSGTVHVAVHVQPSDPIYPPNPCRIYSNLVNVVGTGQDTGLEYRASGGAWSQFDLTLPTTLTFAEFYDVELIQGVPPSPVSPSFSP